MRKALGVIGLVLLVLYVIGSMASGSSTNAPSASSVAAVKTADSAMLAMRPRNVVREADMICRNATHRATELAKKYPDWPDEVVGVVACHHFRIGLTAEQLRTSLGKPERINSTSTASSTSEQWVYGDTYIYVEDGVVTSYQQSR